ncbi:MAG: ribosomal RNA small subunit methyltransferase A [Phycisphaerae bacterium]|nr:ribosomal RNA small subunit methyltransferase A [Phycisphaerae bacterium]
MAQTKHQIQALLTTAGIRPLKRFGQHFLIDGNLMRKLVAAAGIRSDDVVLEVGPGTGSLTQELVALAGHVVAVEIDNTLQAVCRQVIGPSDRFTLIHTDVLESKNRIAPAVGKELAARHQILGGRIALVANLPYQVATPLIINLLLHELSVSPLCFTVQAEVANRFLAAPCTKDYGPVSIRTQALATTERVANVPPEAFWPVPEVDSAMLRIDRHSDAPISPAVQNELNRLVHGCFNHRRKTLRWSLRNLLNQRQLTRAEQDGRWDLSLRPECIRVAQWVALAGFCATES